MKRAMTVIRSVVTVAAALAKLKRGGIARVETFPAKVLALPGVATADAQAMKRATTTTREAAMAVVKLVKQKRATTAPAVFRPLPFAESCAGMVSAWRVSNVTTPIRSVAMGVTARAEWKSAGIAPKARTALATTAILFAAIRGCTATKRAMTETPFLETAAATRV